MDLLERLGAFVCHQEPARSFSLARGYFPLCARCTGLYAGFLAAFAYHVAGRVTRRVTRMPGGMTGILNVVLFMILAVESVGESVGWWSQGCFARFLAGLAGGSAIGVFLYPQFVYFVGRGEPARGRALLLRRYAGLAAVLVVPVLMAACGGVMAASGYFLVAASMTGLMAVYATVNVTVAGALTNFRGRKRNRRAVAVLVAATLSLFAVEILLFRSHGTLAGVR